MNAIQINPVVRHYLVDDTNNKAVFTFRSLLQETTLDSSEATATTQTDLNPLFDTIPTKWEKQKLDRLRRSATR